MKSKSEYLEKKMKANLENIQGIISTIMSTKEYERYVNDEIEALSKTYPKSDETYEEIESLKTQRNIHHRCIESHLDVLDNNVLDLYNDCNEYVALTGGDETSEMVEDFLRDYEQSDLAE